MIRSHSLILLVWFVAAVLSQSTSDSTFKTKLPENTFTEISLSYLNQKIDSANYFYKNNALYLAADQLKFIEKTDFYRYSDSIKFRIGESYQFLSHIYYDMGYIADYKNAIDSMYWYKSKSLKESSEIKSEYFTYLARYYALEMKTYTSKAAIDSALFYFHKTTTSSLQQKYFLIFNYLNILRNTRDTINQLTLEKGVPDHLKLADQYIKSIEKMDIPWYIKSFCYRVRGNIYQDQFWNYTRNEKKNQKQLQLTLDKINTAENYSKKINGIYDISGLHMNLVRALQYNYIDSFDISNQIIEEITNINKIQIGSKTYFRNIPISLFSNKYKVINIFNKNKHIEVPVDEIKMALEESIDLTKIFKIYVIQYMKNNPVFLSEGYNKNVLHDISVLSECLYFKTKNQQFKNITWIYSNQKKYISLLYKMLNLNYNNDFQKMVKILENNSWKQQCLLDQLYLAREGKLIIDTISIEKEIIQLDNDFESALNESPVMIKKFFLDQPFNSIENIQKNMKSDELILNYDFTGYSLKNSNYVVVVKKNLFEIIRLKDDTSDVKNYLIESNFSKQNLKKTINYYSAIYVKPIKNYIQNTQKITIIPSHQIEYLSFDMLVETPCVNNNYEDMSFLGLKYNIRYTPGMNIEYLLNNTPDYTIDSLLVISPNYESSLIASNLPFNKKLTDHLKKEFKAKFISKKHDLSQNEQPTFSIIHIAAHQNLNPKLYNTISVVSNLLDEKYFIFEDSLLYEQDDLLKNYKANLAIVSSCYSGISYIDQFDGKINISKMFLESGVKSVITSTWKLDDYSSATILTEFYRLIAKGYDRSEALWMAKKHFLETNNDPELRNPLYWAGFRFGGKDGKIEIKQIDSDKNWIIFIVIHLSPIILYIFFKKRSAFLQKV